MSVIGGNPNEEAVGGTVVNAHSAELKTLKLCHPQQARRSRVQSRDLCFAQKKRARGLPVAVPLRTDLKQRKRQKPVPHPQRPKRTVGKFTLRSSEHCIHQQKVASVAGRDQSRNSRFADNKCKAETKQELLSKNPSSSNRSDTADNSACTCSRATVSSNSGTLAHSRQKASAEPLEQHHFSPQFHDP